MWYLLRPGVRAYFGKEKKDGSSEAEKVVEILNDAVAKASSATGIEARIILSTLRHYSTQQSLATVKLVERFKGSHVAGIDLGAYEAGFPIYAHIPAFQNKRNNRKKTNHDFVPL